MAKNIPSNENQRPAIKTTLPSKALNQDKRSNKEFPRQKKSKRIHLHQTSSARDAKGTALRKGRKREREALVDIVSFSVKNFPRRFKVTKCNYGLFPLLPLRFFLCLGILPF